MTTPFTATILTKNTSELKQHVQQHVDADRVVQGIYWDAENSKGCFIGCLNHSDNPYAAEQRFGLPVMVQRIAETIFERLPEDEARAFFAALPDAVQCDGKDLSRVGWQFLEAELRAIPPQPEEIQEVIDQVIAGMNLLASGQEWSYAFSHQAAESLAAATLANRDLYPAPARSAARAAREAARAAVGHSRWAFLTNSERDRWVQGSQYLWNSFGAQSAGNATVAAAGASKGQVSSCKHRQRDCLLQLISAAPILPLPGQEPAP